MSKNGLEFCKKCGSRLLENWHYDECHECLGSEKMSQPTDIKILAKAMHNKYEEIAKTTGWKTQKKCQIDFNSLPLKNQETMLLMAKWILNIFDNPPLPWIIHFYLG